MFVQHIVQKIPVYFYSTSLYNTFLCFGSAVKTKKLMRLRILKVSSLLGSRVLLHLLLLYMVESEGRNSEMSWLGAIAVISLLKRKEKQGEGGTESVAQW